MFRWDLRRCNSADCKYWARLETPRSGEMPSFSSPPLLQITYFTELCSGGDERGRKCPKKKKSTPKKYYIHSSPQLQKLGGMDTLFLWRGMWDSLPSISLHPSWQIRTCQLQLICRLDREVKPRSHEEESMPSSHFKSFSSFYPPSSGGTITR